MIGILKKGKLSCLDDGKWTLEWTREQFHHFSKVMRLKEGEEIEILFGGGMVVSGVVCDLSQKSLLFKKTGEEERNPEVNVDLAVCLVKKDDMALVLRQSVELGVRKLIPTVSKRSMKEFIKPKRVESILNSSLEQSRNALIPEITKITQMSEISFSHYDHCFIFHPYSGKKGRIDLKKNERILILIGPQGGFSEEEVLQLAENPNASFVSLPTPIMRTPTAMACSIGHVIGKYIEE